ncbi:Glycine--tRNA ligase 1, mitochondrial [Entomophthora muscae]|uniref:Glycine--tRNA ligase 1, mitochondrial n=1 Tax=Entomophthora muscae TaxID=34485 RepID=A0ACC2T257_9FUNG|nr:Glycine--tRNA ligase 1, mitochondrial [Entomophthora muscae]
MSTTKFDRSVLEQMLTKRFFYAPSNSIYGGVAGFFDYGPPGTALQSNIISLWRQHFVLEEDMLEVDCSIITPEEVLKTSGHVAKFADWMVKDLKNGEIFRADHLVDGFFEAKLEGDRLAREAESGEAVATTTSTDKPPKKSKKKNVVVNIKLEDSVRAEYEEIRAKMDNYGGEELGEIIKKYNITSPEANNPLSAPKEFNLMFETAIGPSGQLKGYLRPETAQGQFVNFKKLLEFNNDKVPFASCHIGRSFRNEISPRSGLLRVREFMMAEIEHYLDPEDKSHPKFAEVRSRKLRFLSSATQLSGKTDLTELEIGQAVDSKLVDNETLGYFLVRIYLFLIKIGIKPDRLRFRQHMANEMAHYACDCWDAEILTSYGWIECVGCADRSAYDLTVHSQKTKEKLVVRKALAQPLVYQKTQLNINRKVFGSQFKKDAKIVEDHLNSLSEAQLDELSQQLQTSLTITASNGTNYELTKDMLSIERVEVREHVREFTPSVIEPSFGIGRILYALLEHSFWAREEDEQRGVLSFPVAIAPIKCLILPIANRAEFSPIINDIGRRLRKANLSSRVDDSAASIGKRYSRNDELGTPFGITVDQATLQDGTVTLRERDSTHQIRADLATIIGILVDLVSESTSWPQVTAKYPIISQPDAEE